MAYRHRVVQGLAELLDRYGGGSDDPIMRAIWWGIRGQVPMILHQLDDSEEAIALIEGKMREVLGIKEEKLEVKEIVIEPAPVPMFIEEIREAVKKAPPKRKRLKKQELVEAMEEPAVEVTEFEAIIEPAEE